MILNGHLVSVPYSLNTIYPHLILCCFFPFFSSCVATAVCIVLAAGSEIQANLRFNISGFHEGCTGYTFGYPPLSLSKVGVPVRHAQSYLH